MVNFERSPDWSLQLRPVGIEWGQAVWYWDPAEEMVRNGKAGVASKRLRTLRVVCVVQGGWRWKGRTACHTHLACVAVVLNNTLVHHIPRWQPAEMAVRIGNTWENRSGVFKRGRQRLGVWCVVQGGKPKTGLAWVAAVLNNTVSGERLEHYVQGLDALHVQAGSQQVELIQVGLDEQSRGQSAFHNVVINRGAD
eukprot:CAMPEP_0175811712 /NCGR_PEP_ID=MMETSP0107_2-20121207/3992_1 /TAXON_ID=195067 ORGANISM="Goniomonas pacifica, Strain CCMP1869" /NCGR_SAMPLE_ID=MMETSP0107_2 /ASSEMBLY_ACC=CAM_ASM_000203 /LENGTH=194 /DNA_ID=CAMNT_0017123531 /DNA_START=135 /DNA_END=719 /DNA_ORIENTATION=-